MRWREKLRVEQSKAFVGRDETAAGQKVKKSAV